MKDYITEMMVMAGIDAHARGCTNEDVNEYTDYYSNDCEGDCIDCTWYDSDKYYPDFNAEKQLEIIKLIGFNSNFSLIINKLICGVGEQDKYRLTFSEHRGYKIYQAYNEDFTQALAHLTTKLMEVRQLDKQKVKEILENDR